jgi:hypothetical protein
MLGVLAGAITLTALPVSAQAPSGGGAGTDMTIEVSVSDVSALIGDTFAFTSEIANNGPEASLPLIAHLSVASVDLGTYVDPEDWSPRRTVRVAPIGAGSSATQYWTVNPILKGEVAIYVVVLPASGTLGASPLIASPAIYVLVEQRRTLNPEGVLPVVIAVPGVLAVALAGMTIARRRRMRRVRWTSCQIGVRRHVVR